MKPGAEPRSRVPQGAMARAGRRRFGPRRHARRVEARRVIQARTKRAVTGTQRAHDAIRHPRAGVAVRMARVVATLASSLVVHALVVAIGLAIGGFHLGRRERIEQTVKIEVRERPPEPKPEPPKPPEPEPPKLDMPVPREPPKVVKTPPPKAPEPPAPVPTAPARIVGLSLEATVEGGGGPSFAVGNTRAGQTASTAVAAKDVSATAADVPVKAPVVAAPAGNQVATRLPVAGVVYTLPKRRKPSQPEFPVTLKAQGVEADVTVVVQIDVGGKVTDVKVIKAAPYPEFNEAARAAALVEEFDPATRDGVPMARSLSFTYQFRLEQQ